MHNRNTLIWLCLASFFTLIFGAFVAQSVVQAQIDPASDLPAVSTPSGSGSGGHIPLGQQDCNQLEQTFDAVVIKRMAVHTAYSILSCDQVLDNPNSTASEIAQCTNLDRNLTYWTNYASAVRSVAIIRQCDWAIR